MDNNFKFIKVITSFQVFGKMNGSYTEGSKGKWIF